MISSPLSNANNGDKFVYVQMRGTRLKTKLAQDQAALDAFEVRMSRTKPAACLEGTPQGNGEV